MKDLSSCFGKKLYGLCSSSTLMCQRFVLVRLNPFWIQLCYFISLSFLGFGFLKALRTRTHDSFTPRNLDFFFTSVSAATVSSMSTVEMEVFSNPQLIVLTILMFTGGEVFTSMVGLHLSKSQLKRRWTNGGLLSAADAHHIEVMSTAETKRDSENLESGNETHTQRDASLDLKLLKFNSIRFLGFVVLGYLFLVHFLGISLVLFYLAIVSSASNVLKTKGLNKVTFSFFTIVSTSASCGFVPTNENMMVFSKNSGLLLILVPQVLLGNTLFPPCLRFSVWFLGKFFKKEESGYLLSESNKDALSGLNSFQKIVGVLFQVVNTRHTGETIVDLSIVSPAILVLFIVMMYLPPYTSFLPVNDNPQTSGRPKKRRGKLLEDLIFSQLSYLIIFIILICITERKKMKEDPLNFNALNIVVEVISAYGNVGFTTGYSCKRQLQPDSNCKDKWYGFSGKWSDEGKIILMVVMFFGRLKKFNMDGGKAWILL
ncbi:cation transporter HKT1;3 isoform X2 [Hevea brasiliensis]|uniref:cation transporter HKT1;3 isoform X2 n=1 Tax=Hevea brasiliensis TaxID=3981 RepID=UPI0025DFFEE1|nr:cation transporter HKT1;3 isoform X2 [Hevea brasiliensis]